MVSFSVLVLATLMACAAGHSYLTYPQPIRQGACRQNKQEPTCKGPCQADYKTWTWTHFSPATGVTAATFGRGQKFNMKYTRNNHTPGGFQRVTIVPMDKVMDKKAHAEGAFHYSCWGSGVTVATKEESTRDDKNFDLIGQDGLTHDYAPGYYSTYVTIPKNIPDGIYMLGWVWYGGMGGGASAIRNEEQEGGDKSFFGDYWSCSYITISGGAPLEDYNTPVFINTKRQFSDKGCKTAANRIGVCTFEPCRGTVAWYGVPEEFEGGKTPAAIPSSFYGGAAPQAPPPADEPTPTSAPAPEPVAPPAPVVTDAPATAPPAAPQTNAAPAPEPAAAPAPQSAQGGMYMELIRTGLNAAQKGEPLPDGVTVCPKDYTWGFSIACKGVPAGTSKVSFYDGTRLLREEAIAPYTINGDNAGRANAWRAYKLGGTNALKCETDSGASVEVTIKFAC